MATAVSTLPLSALPGVTPESVTAMNEVEKGMLLSIIWSKLNQLSQDMHVHATGAAYAVAELKAELGVVRAELSSRPAKRDSPSEKYFPEIQREVAKDTGYPYGKGLSGQEEMPDTTSPAAEADLLSLSRTLNCTSMEALPPETPHRDKCCPTARIFEGSWQRAFRRKAGNASPPRKIRANIHGVQTPPRPTRLHEFKNRWEELPHSMRHSMVSSMSYAASLDTGEPTISVECEADFAETTRIQAFV